MANRNSCCYQCSLKRSPFLTWQAKFNITLEDRRPWENTSVTTFTGWLATASSPHHLPCAEALSLFLSLFPMLSTAKVSSFALGELLSRTLQLYLVLFFLSRDPKF